MYDLNDIVLAATAGLVSASAFLIARLRDHERTIGDERRKRLDAEETLITINIKRENVENDLQAKLEASRTEAAEQRRIADDAKRVAEIARKEAAVELREGAMRVVEEAREGVRLEAAETEMKLVKREERVQARENVVAEKEELAAQRDLAIARREAQTETERAKSGELHQRAIKLVDERQAKLQAVAGMSGEEARRNMMEELLDVVRRDSARAAKEIEDVARQEAEKKAKRIIGIAIQRYAGEHVQERATTSIHLAHDDMKGRIIGKEGRNIRALQETLGVDLIIDDTPETIVVSAFDPVRREVARMAIEMLLEDGRIHPSRIEEVALLAQERVDSTVTQAAEAAFMELGITRMHHELSRLVGNLKFRYSHGQNVLRHSIECGFLAGLMAAELGQNEKVARRAALLHDIGKAVSHEQEGGHAMVGAAYARKHGEDPIVVNAIAAHHEDEQPSSVIASLVMASDALSGARPGARREMLDGYVKRLRDLEEISTRFAGVTRAFAIQAGREVRVIVEPSEVSDVEAALLAREISKRIEEELNYPGQIRVTVVRETRAIDYAK
ncbi:MAG TPA: ribonuclease Y [Polyangiaceae bacterium]